MKTYILSSALMATTISGVSAAPQVAPTTPGFPQPIIVVIDTQKVFADSKAAQGVQVELEKKRVEFQDAMTKLETELRTKHEDLEKKRTTMSEADFKKASDAFEKRVAEVQMKRDVLKFQMESAFEAAREQINAAMLKASDAIKSESGANLVLQKQMVLADSSFDVTEKVSAKLNKDLPSVKLTYKPEAEILKEVQAQK